jgi:hypothetical protein
MTTLNRMTTQAALADLNSRLLADLSTRLVSKAEPTDLLGGILDAGIRITGAEMGNIQLRNVRTGQLEIVVQRGFEAESPIFAGADALGVLLRAGVRAVQSTPLWSPSGELVGMLSTYHRRAYSPEESDLQLLDMLAGLCHRLTIRPQGLSPYAAGRAPAEVVPALRRQPHQPGPSEPNQAAYPGGGHVHVSPLRF